MREERIALKDHAGVAPVRRKPRDIHAIEQHPTCRGFDEAGDHAQRGGLAASARTEEGNQFAIRDVEREVRDGVGRAVAFSEVFQTDACHDQTTWLSLTKRSVISMMMPSNRI